MLAATHCIFLDPLIGQDPQFGKRALEPLPDSPSSQVPCPRTSCSPSQHTSTHRTPHASPLPLTPRPCHLLGNMVRPPINPALVKVSLPPSLHLLPLRKIWPEIKKHSHGHSRRFDFIPNDWFYVSTFPWTFTFSCFLLSLPPNLATSLSPLTPLPTLLRQHKEPEENSHLFWTPHLTTCLAPRPYAPSCHSLWLNSPGPSDHFPLGHWIPLTVPVRGHCSSNCPLPPLQHPFPLFYIISTETHMLLRLSSEINLSRSHAPFRYHPVSVLQRITYTG